MKINDFSGGLSTRIDPTLIGLNEAVIYTNVDNSRGSLTSIKNYLLQGIPIDRWFYKFKNTWYSSINNREYIEYKNKLYWTEKDNIVSKVNNGLIKPVGIVAPQTKLTTVTNATGSIITTGSTVVQYMYTYYDSSEGIESAPSPVSDELTLNANKSVDISGFVASDNQFADLIRLYRVGANTTDFTLLVELPIYTATYNDNIKTLDAIGDILDAYNNQPPLIGLRYIIEAYGIMFAVKGNNLYYSETGFPDYWPTLNSIPFSADLTGLVAIPDGIVIFTNSKAYILLGTDPTSFRIILLNPEHGCIEHNSIRVVKNTLLWAAADGICALSGNSITVITKEKLNRVTFQIVSTTVYNEQYIVTLLDGTAFIVDVRFNGSVFKNIKYTLAPIYNIGVFDNVLYGVVNEQLALLDKGELIDFYYMSPLFTEGDASVTKLYNNIYITANGRFIFEVYIDEIKVSSDELIGNQIFEIKVPQEKQRGSNIQFYVQGTGVVREIEYKTVGRENGR